MSYLRRHFLQTSALLGLGASLPAWAQAQTPPAPVAAPARARFAPQSGAWRTFDVTTRIHLLQPQ